MWGLNDELLKIDIRDLAKAKVSSFCRVESVWPVCKSNIDKRYKPQFELTLSILMDSILHRAVFMHKVQALNWALLTDALQISVLLISEILPRNAHF